MPCIYNIEDYPENKDMKINMLKEQLDKITHLLCFLCKQIELGDNANFNCPEVKELWEWWEVHKKFDAT